MDFFSYYITKISPYFTSIYSFIVVIGLATVLVLIILAIIQVYLSRMYKKQDEEKDKE